MRIDRHTLPWSLVLGLTVASSAVATGQDVAGIRADRRAAPAKSETLIPSQRFQISLADVPRAELGALDLALLLAEDQAAAHFGYRKLRVGVPQHLIMKLRDGAWRDVKGGRLWTAEISAAGALGMRVHFSGMNLPRGAELHLYDPAQPQATRVGPYAGNGPVGDRELWAGSIFSDVVRIEYYEPSNAIGGNSAQPFVIDDIQHYYRDIRPKSKGGGGEGAGSCHNDPVCFPAWADVADSVARLLYVDGGTWVCSGQLINTVASDETPYFLTAYHCIASNSVAATAEFLWGYERTTCGSGSPATGTTSSVAQFISAWSLTDTTLLLILGEIPADVYWSGWTSSAITSGTASTCVHHPSGDYKRISFGTKFNTPNCGGPATHFVLADWNSGVTEGGSSGSGFWRDSDQLLFGTLTCGASACSAQTADDSYGRFDTAYSNALSGPLAAGSDDPLEENDTCATAHAPANGTWSNLVVKSTDEDWYQFTVASGAALDVDLTFTHDHGDIDMSLHDACAGASIVSSTSATDDESISWTNLTGSSATVYLRVHLYSDTRNTYDMTINDTSPSGPPNDDCINAFAVGDGTFAFDNNGATTDGPDEAGDCTFFGYSQIDSDVWYRYTAPCDGQATVLLCGSGYDTKLAVYDGTCPTAPGTSLACNDDACAVSSIVSFPVASGQEYLIRIGGYQGDQGTGTLDIICTPDCPADLSGDDVVDVTDLLDMLTAWGPNPGHAADLNGDDVVNVLDLLELLAVWGPC